MNRMIFPALSQSKIAHHKLSSDIGGIRQDLSEKLRDLSVAQSPEQTDDVQEELLGMSSELLGMIGHLKVWCLVKDEEGEEVSVSEPCTRYELIDKIKYERRQIYADRQTLRVVLALNFFETLRKEWDLPE